MKINKAFLRIKRFLKLPIHYRNLGLVWKYGGVVRKFGLIHLLIPVLLGTAVIGTVVTQLPNFRISDFKFTKPKPIIASNTLLPQNIQQAIENLAAQEIKEDQADANLNIHTSSGDQSGLASSLILNVQEAVTSNPSEKAKIKLKKIDILIAELQDQTPNQVVEIIKEIGKLTDEIVRDPQVQADRQVLQLLIEQYNRSQLILQQLEDKLPVTDYLKVEDARQKYLVITATQSINNAPNLDAVHNIALKEVAKVVGDDFAELKAIEIISDFEAGIKPEAKEKLTGLERQLAVDFEKRMLKLPQDVRNKKLHDFIKYSFGNPIRQVQAFDKMKSFLSNKEIVSGVDSLKNLALQKVEDRVSQLPVDSDKQDFLSSLSPQNVKDLEKIKQAVLSKEEKQTLYEKIQAIVQRIFLTSGAQKSDLEKQLPEDVQSEIQKLKHGLPDRNVPKIETPEGVVLPEIAKLPDDVEKAILIAAKKKIEAGKRPKDVELDLTVSAKDLKVADPIILPDNPLYFIKRIFRQFALVLGLDPVTRAQRLISQDNEKTLEAAKLVQISGDTKTIELALNTLKEVQEDFDKLKKNAKALEQLPAEKVDKLVNQIIENGVARQTVLASILDKVYGDTYVEVEKIRSDILKDGVDTLLELTNNNVPSLTDKLEQAVEQISGSDLNEIKAIELLTEIKKDQPAEIQPILEESIDQLTQKLEDQLLQLPEEERVEKVLAYIAAEPGNPVIQFQAADELKDHFDNPQLVELAEGIKDAAVENLTDLISEIDSGEAKQEFVDIVVGDQVEDLKIITDIEIRVTPPEAEITGETTPIVEEIKEIKAEIEQNIIDRYVDNPEQLTLDVLPEEGHGTDILDVNVIQEIVEVLERSPEVAPEVIKEAQKLETEVIDDFVETVSTDASQALTPAPEVIEELENLKDDVPSSIDVKIDAAIEAEVTLIQNHLAEVSDPQIFETYIEQIEQNPVVEKVITEVGGSEFIEVIEQKTAEIQVTATQEQTTLVETVKQIEQEIFTSPVNQPSEVEQTLPEIIQEEIKEIKEEVPVEQVPEVTVEATVNVTVPTETEPAPAPAAPEVTAPAPEPAQPAAPPPEAPTVPGL